MPANESVIAGLRSVAYFADSMANAPSAADALALQRPCTEAVCGLHQDSRRAAVEINQEETLCVIV